MRVNILVNGSPIKTYNHGGNNFIEARNGTEYSIRIYNDGCTRKLAVITVDGINVIDGNPQGEEKGIGYIVNAYSSIEVKGFRNSTDSVGAFKFCKKGKSYCNDVGLAGNNGVIGVRFYDELHSINVPGNMFRSMNAEWNRTSNTEYSKGMTDRSAPIITCSCTNSVAPEFELGTTWGSQIKDKVTNIKFQSCDNVFWQYIVYYDTKQNLKKIGIKFDNETQISSFPSAFNSFATPPKDWKK